ncbi:MAG: hypothetical protein ACYC7F_01660, partial [Gemmatimonadaceae bacterium]
MRTLDYAVLFAAVAVAACAKEVDEAGTGARVVTGVTTAIVAEQPFTEILEATAVVSGRPDHLATLSAPSTARVS